MSAALWGKIGRQLIEDAVRMAPRLEGDFFSFVIKQLAAVFRCQPLDRIEKQRGCTVDAEQSSWPYAPLKRL